jgi:hypothetical protein
MNDNRPIHEIRLGRIKAAIWQNESDHGIRLSVSIARIYRKEDRWQSTTSFGRDDLPLVVKVADMAHTWIYEHGKDYRGSGSTNGENDQAVSDFGNASESAA